MASSYDETCKLIYGAIFDKLERKNEPNLRFAPRSAIKLLLQHDNHALLRRLFRCLEPTGGQPVSGGGTTLSEDEFVRRVGARKLFNFWGTLVFATCGLGAANAALHRLVAADAWPFFPVDERKLGSLLPLTRTQLNNLFGDEIETDKFFSHQACFCAVVLRNREEVVVQDASCQRLPYLAEDGRGEGAFGHVYYVKVAKNHFFDAFAEAAKAYNGRPQDMARKDYIIKDVNQAREEYAIMKTILSSNMQKREHNIVQSWGSLQIEKSYSLFMPLAICDLHTFMMEQQRNAPQGLKDRADVVYSAAGLASGLNYLHSGMRTDELEELVCYHMDLKPQNVLIFQENGRNVWKLSDFGMARVKMRTRNPSSPPERDFTSLFQRRKPMQDPSQPATINRRGEGTWQAPESIAAEPRMRTDADVWSLGCVLSVVFAYLGGGAEGVTDYGYAREAHRRADGSDRFFLRSAEVMKPHKMHPVVKAWHDRLVAAVPHTCVGERKALARVLTFLQDEVLRIKESERCNAGAVKLELETTYRMLQDAINNDAPPSTMAAGLENFIQEQKQKLALSKIKSPSAARLISRRLSSSDDFKGLAISPNANCLAYCTNSKIVFYTSESLSLTEEHASTLPSEWNLPNEECCFLQSICLTNRYLVASTTGKNFLYVFDLEGGLHVDLNLTTVYRVSLDGLAIRSLAISPNNKTLAFVMRDESKMRGPGTLVYTSLPGLIALIRQELRNLPESSDPNSQQTVGISSSHGLLNNSIELDWPAADIEHLSVSDADDAYVVVRPALTARTREHKIPVAHIWRDQSVVPARPTVDTLNIVSLGFDGSSTSGFFTTFCVVNDRDTCAIVTRGKRFHLQKFDEPDIVRAENQRDIAHYRIAKLFNSGPTGKLFAIGNVSSKQNMMLVEVRLSPTLDVRELVKIPDLFVGDDVVAVAVESTDKTLIIVASLTGASRRAIHKITIPRQGQ
ncbi:Protein kinase-like domain protein [Cordyceps fumosorosea ARSEF 2679]|uniref:Protein kinase-like domain protein n=1 Tax=Cordyceps fumosorosea (strain ARSEF 2679) TaxID=1081104 RepID=A0A167XEZ6_CORFA|nr:Protein kinase-like domain protein [Cordyceps fumosorosea ARSEF 2679]OAA64898.1 Protein kinase-like domain protein [Cordyceps fumosorosea ARSEF 2679]